MFVGVFVIAIFAVSHTPRALIFHIICPCHKEFKLFYIISPHGIDLNTPLFGKLTVEFYQRKIGHLPDSWRERLQRFR